MIIENIISKLINILGENNVLLDDKSKEIYGKDLTQNNIPNPVAVALPTHEQEVIEIVKLANATKTPIVPSGGRTGYSGGAVAKNQEIVVSFEKMNRILDINLEDRLIKCQAGVTTKTIQDFAAKNNLIYPIDFASVATCQIGGNIATNAGGIHVIKYGLTRNWVYGLKVVTGNGDLLDLNRGLTKNADGYDLRHLFIGSEGTLGLITEATLKLATPYQSRVIFLSIPDKNHMIDIFEIYSSKLSIIAFEFFSNIALRHVLTELNLDHPFSRATPFYILLEYESDEIKDETAQDITKKCVQKGMAIEALISKNLQEASYFWRFRKEISMALLKHSPYKFDIAVLSSKVAHFIDEADAIFNLTLPDIKIIWFGHIGDGNLHLNILKPRQLAENIFVSHCNKISDNIYSLIKKYQGTISAEHGVGLIKKDFLHYNKTETEINYLKKIKAIFDYNNLINTGKIF